jgi:restriction system protein
VITPLDESRLAALGTWHTRPVRWIKTDGPRSSLDQDILDSLGYLLTVGQIKRNNIEERIRAMLTGRRQPVVPPTPGPVGGEDEGIVTDPVSTLDVEQYARDQIRSFIGRKFRGHELARLVTELMKAQGYQTRISPPGADGGVDIIGLSPIDRRPQSPADPSYTQNCSAGRSRRLLGPTGDS